MYFTGFADEAAKDLAGQIEATKALGWNNIESRAIDGTNIHDLDDAAFDRAASQLEDAGIKINCFGSTIANWGKSILDPFEVDLEIVKRAIPRMHRLGTKLVRIMSYKVLEDRPPEDQLKEERYARLREITKLFLDEGIQPLHENCMNYAGRGWSYTLDMLDNVPGLKLIFDTGNPVNLPDWTKPAPWPMQSSWEFYSAVKDYVQYIHIKDGVFENNAMRFTYAGEGDGDVARILGDLAARGYDGGISIEPHLGLVFHDSSVESTAEWMRASYIEYGRRVEALWKSACAKAGRSA